MVIPAGVREALQISPGDRLTLTIEEDRLVLEPQRLALRRTRGMYKHLAAGRSLVNELIADRREEARREEPSAPRSSGEGGH